MWKSVVVDQAYTWADDRHPKVPWEDTIIYEAHVKGLTQTREDIPKELRGTYRGLAAPAMIEHLQQARRHRDRASADPRLRRRAASARQRPEELLGLQHAVLLRARAALLRRQHPERVPLHGRRAAQRRHRGHPRRGLQPHLRGQPSRPDALLQGHRQHRLLLARPRQAALLRELHRHRQRAEARASARAADGDGLAALLGRGVPRRRLPLRSGLDARPHAGVRSATARSSPRSARTRCSPTSR